MIMKRFLLSFMLLAVSLAMVADNIAYAALSKDATTLTFSYGTPPTDLLTWEVNNTGVTYPGWYDMRAKITKVVFEPYFAFARPKSCDWWFYEFSNLATIEGIENLNTSEVWTMCCMFYGCSSLSELDVSNFDTSKVKHVMSMFYECSSLTSLDVSNFDMSNVIDMQCMFYGCSSLKSLDISNFDTSNAMQLYGMFWDCSSLVNLNIGTLDVGKSTSLQLMFAKCESLKNLYVHIINTSKVTDFHSMFTGCKSLKSIDVSSMDVSSAEDVRSMFNNCTDLETIYCGKDWNKSDVNSDYMFWGSNKLKGATSYTESQIKISMANPETGYFTYPPYAMLSSDGKTMTFKNDKNMPATNSWCVGNTTLWGPAWLDETNVENITNVVFEPSFAEARPECCTYWFAFFENLQSIEGIEYLNTSESTSLRGIFYDCEKLTSIDVSHFDTQKVTDMYCSFAFCYSLNEIDLSQFDTRSAKTMHGMFYDCYNMKKLDLSSFNTSNVKNMGSMFAGCNSLTELNVSSFDTSNTTYMVYMFSNCTSLSSINLNNFDLSNAQDISLMFNSCNALTTIYCDNDWQQAELVSEEMFSGCTSLKGAVEFDSNKLDAAMANPTTGYFTKTGSSGIDNISLEKSQDVPIYNLLGRRLNAPQKGINIISGKKIFVR